MGNNSEAAEKTKQTNTSPADVIMWSGCKDSQTSADATEAGKATGAMSYVGSRAHDRDRVRNADGIGLYCSSDQVPPAELCAAIKHYPRRIEGEVRPEAAVVG
jgi:hypothetical protein